MLREHGNGLMALAKKMKCILKLDERAVHQFDSKDAGLKIERRQTVLAQQVLRTSSVRRKLRQPFINDLIADSMNWKMLNVRVEPRS